ncbi:MAG: PAS domain-containing protein [bacterium]|nr:MAG: PAS domain-containing protein [bacterium]
MAPRAEPFSEQADKELRVLLKVLMIFRVATVSLFLGVTVVIQVKGTQALFFAPLYSVYLLIVSVYILTIFLASVFNNVEDLHRFAVFQVGLDLALSTIIVYLSGGFDSPFPFLYLLSILWASLAFPAGGYWTASFSAIMYGAVVDLMYYGILTPPIRAGLLPVGSENPFDVVGRVALHITAFFAVAFLGHQMARRYRSTSKALTERTVDLEKLQHLSDVVFDSINSGIAVLDTTGRVRSLNAAGFQILGIQESSLRSLGQGGFFKGLPIGELCEKSIGGRLNRWEGTFTDAGGTERTLGLSISQLKEPEKGFVVIFQDLTEFRELEDKLRWTEQLSVLGRMAASIAHEVRNPLASMSGSIQILQNSLELEDEDRKLMDIVLTETRRLNHLVEDFLTYARPPVPRFEDVDLREVVSDTVQFLRTGIQSRDIHLKTDLPEEPVILSLDSSQIRQVIINLVKNSLDAVDGSGRISVSVERGDRNSGPVTLLSVSDDGSGIPEDILPVIFEPFKTNKEGGSGLGLAVVYQLIQAHHAAIDVRSVEGEGTTVTVQLPRWRSQ